ncbi:MAG: 16S rRNA (guanine(527)-N(7))-methyltransferase RsmG [Alphaproteobacteria bacterium]
MTELLDPMLEKYCKDNFQNSSDVSTKLLEYKKLLLDTNQHMNLIGKSTIDDFDQRHFLDCIQIHEHMTEKDKLTVDLGTGAGFPGILLSIIGYQRLHLVEKSPKKSAFLESCKLRLGLDCNIHNQPLAEVSLSNARYIVARAFAPISKILNFTKLMVADQTQYVLLKGRSYLEELKLVSNQSFSWKDFPSITSDESRIIVLQAR